MIFSEKAAQGQLKAYNKRNIEEFLKWYTEDIKAIDIDTDTVLFTGKGEMRKRYAKKFQNVFLFCELKNRIVVHRTVVDHERIIHNQQRDTFDAIAIYDVEESGLISTVRFSKGKV